MNNFSNSRGRAGPSTGTSNPPPNQLLTQIKNAIFAQLGKQGSGPGWRAQISQGVRAGYIMEIFSAHQLARQSQVGRNVNPQEMREILGRALEYERNAMLQSQEPEVYKNQIHQKLRQLQNAREQNSSNMPMGPNIQMQHMTPLQQPIMPNHNSFNGISAPPQLQQSYMGNGQPAFGGQAQAQSFDFQGANGQQNMSRPLVPTNQPQVPTPIAQPGGAQLKPPPLTPADQQRVHNTTNMLMRQLHQQGNVEQMRKQAAANVPPELLQQLRNNGMDVLQCRCREQALNTLHLGQHFPSQPSHGTIGMPMPSSTNNPADGTPAIDLFLGQQADAQRSLEAGNLVVPASNNQGFGGQLGLPNTNLPNDGNAGRPIQRVNNTTGQNKQPGLRQPQSSNAPQPIAGQPQGRLNPQEAARRQPNGSMLTGMVGGLQGGLHSAQQAHTVSPAMPWLNRPLATPDDQRIGSPAQRSPAMPPRIQQTPSQTGVPFQHQQPAPVRTNQANGSTSEPGPHNFRLPATLPDSIRNQIAGQSAQQAQNILRVFYEANRNKANDPRLPMQQSAQAPHTAARALAHQGGARLNNANSHNEQVHSQHMAASRQPEVAPAMQRGLSQQMPGSAQSQIRQPNDVRVPRDALKQVAPQLDIPQHIENWGQLKHWFGQNPMIASRVDQQALQNVHVAQWRSLMQQVNPNNQAHISAAPPNAQNAMPQPVPPGIPIPQHLLSQANALAQRKIIQVAKGFARVHVTPEELQIYRQQFGNRPQAANLSDESFRIAIMKQKLKNIAQVDETWAQSLFKHAHAVIAAAAKPANGQPQQFMPGQHQQQAARSVQMGPDQKGQTGIGMTRDPQPVSHLNVLSQQPTHNGPTQQNSPMAPSGPLLPNMVTPRMPPNLTKPTASQIANMRPDQRAESEARVREGQQPFPPTQGTGNWAVVPREQKETQLQRIMSEVARDFPRGPRVELSTTDYEFWAKAVRGLGKSLARFVEGVKMLFFQKGQESLARDILACVLKIKQQLRPDGQAIEFTATPAELQEVTRRFRLFASTHMSGQSQGQGGLQGPQGTKLASQQMDQTTPAHPTTAQPGSSTNNLPNTKQEPLTEKRMPAKKNATKAVQSTTAPQAPIPLGTPTPDGRIMYGQSQNFNLHLPDKKRRRLNQKDGAVGATGTNVGDLATSPEIPQSVASTRGSTTTSKEPPTTVLNRPHKCSIPGCEYQESGFEQESQREEHEKMVHNYTGDALAFCLTSMRKALGLQTTGEISKESSAVPSASTNKPAVVKTESRINASTAMNREQSATNDGPRSDQARIPSQSQDPWASSSLKPAEINSLFGEIEGITEINPFGTGAIDWPNPPTPPASPPSLSIELSEGTKPQALDSSSVTEDTDMMDKPLTPTSESWQKIIIPKDAGLKRSALDELRDRTRNRKSVKYDDQFDWSVIEAFDKEHFPD